VPKLLIAGKWRKRIDESAVYREARWRAEAATMATLWGLFGLLRPEQASRTGRWLLERLGPRFHKSDIMRRTLRIAFPEKDEAAIEAILRDAWGNMGAVLAEYPHLHTICRPGSGYVESSFDFEAAAERAGGRGIIFAGAHLSHWEIGAAGVALAGVPMAAVYRPLENPYVDRRLRRLREGLGCRLLARDSSARELIKAALGGAALGLIVDHRDDDGVPLPCFGHDKLTTLAPARVALRLNTELYAGRAIRLGPARYRIATEGPIEPDDPAADFEVKAIQMTRKLNALFEAWIRERPGEWLCTKRPWAKELYKKGRRPKQAAPSAATAG
jgi:KDO2-lipid IV(A) lauroyltransferase